jgi:hypothetical protein
MEVARIAPFLVEAMHMVNSEQRSDSRSAFRVNWSGFRVSTRRFRPTIIPDVEVVHQVPFMQNEHTAPRNSPLSDSNIAYTAHDNAGLTEAELYTENMHNRRTIALWEGYDHEDQELLLPEEKKEHEEKTARNIVSQCSKEREAVCAFIDAWKDAPNEFYCPITLQAMRIPVVAADGHSYDKNAIIAHYRNKPYNSPIMNAPVNSEALFPNYCVASLMESWVAKNTV